MIEGITLATTPDYADNNHWMNLLQIDSKSCDVCWGTLMSHLDQNGIQTRPVWTLNHEQKPYIDCQYYKVANAKKLVENSLCLPSSTNLTNEDINRIVSQLRV
jgi:perosamine synthetase